MEYQLSGQAFEPIPSQSADLGQTNKVHSNQTPSIDQTHVKAQIQHQSSHLGHHANSQTNISKPNGPRAGVHLYMSNERNVFISIFIGCILLMLAFYLSREMDSPSKKWMAFTLSSCAIATVIYGLVVYKRNFEAFEANQQEHINWYNSQMFIYGLSGLLIVVALFVTHELYWKASQSNTSTYHVESTTAPDTSVPETYVPENNFDKHRSNLNDHTSSDSGSVDNNSTERNPD